MVVHTQTERVREAQEAVVEFLLINHPLDCPVCDKGGECPLQDISFGWGGGRSRFIEPKRHFDKPLALSPLIAIDRERCILCYRCVRFSQEVSEDYQLVLQERGAAHLRRDVRRPPVRRAVQRQHHRAVPGRRADLAALPLPRAAVGHRGRRARSARCARRSATSPSPSATSASCACSAATTTRSTTAGCATRAASPTRRSTSTSASPRRWSATAASCARSRGSARSTRPRGALKRAGGRVGAIAGGETTNEEGFLLQRLLREALELARPRLAPRRLAAARRCTRALGTPALQATVADLEFAHAVLVLDASPSTTRRSSTCASARACAATASSSRSRRAARRRSTPTPPRRARFAPGRRRGAARRRARRRRVGGSGDVDARLAERRRRRRRRRARARRAAARRRRRRRDPLRRAAVAGPRGAHAARALLNVADALGARAAATAPACSSVPAGANGRGLREVGVLPNAGPGFAEPSLAGRTTPRDRRRRRRRRARPRCTCCTSTRCATCPAASAWERALDTATTVVAHAAFLTEGIREHATVVFPAESYAEKEGTVTHPDGRAAAPAPGDRPPGRRRAPSGRCSPSSPSALGHRPRRAHRPDGHRAARRRGAVLRRADARRDRRATACAGTSAPQAGASRRPTLGPFDLEAPPAAPAHRRRAPAARHVPLDLGGARGRGLARAEVPAPRASASSCRPPTPQRLGVVARRARRRRLERHERRARPSRCATTMPDGHASSSRTDDRPRTSASALDGRRSSRCASRERPARSPRSAYVRAVVDPDPQVDRDLRRRPADPAGRDRRRAQAPRPLPEPLRPQPRRPVRRCCSRSPTSSSSRPRSSSARAPRSAGCSRSRR